MLFSLIFIICGSVAGAFVVELPYGSIEGAEYASRSGKTYYGFRGVQYAKASRFQDPQKPDSWEGVKKSTEFATACPQLDFFSGKILTDEDCLYLNVYTQSLDVNAELPVLVWFHGGASAVGSGAFYGPDYLMDHPIVLVIPNFRLGNLGFMHLDDSYLTGNYGMKDQVAVLQWVRENIRQFGGNADKVTLAGSSSGAASVNWHLYSSKSEGLFHQIICQSGTARSIWAEIPRHVAKQRARAVAAMAGCLYKKTIEVVKCLQRLPIGELIELQLNFQRWKKNPYYFGVVVEAPVHLNKNPFVTISPWTPDVPVVSQNIPLIIGFTSDEGGFTAQGLLENKGAAIEELGKRNRDLFPMLMLYQYNANINTEEELMETTEKIKMEYFGQEEVSVETWAKLKQMLADSQVIYDTIETLLEYKDIKYFYKYSHRNTKSFIELETNYLDDSGPVHSDDLISIFKLYGFSEKVEGDDLIVSQRMVSLWVNFVINGNPNTGEIGGPEWQLATNDLEFYNIDIQSEMRNWEWKKTYEFWKGFNWH